MLLKQRILFRQFLLLQFPYFFMWSFEKRKPKTREACCVGGNDLAVLQHWAE
ncbi:MAG: hypothetical protein ACLRR3_00435 [Eubacterium sp.]